MQLFGATLQFNFSHKFTCKITSKEFFIQLVFLKISDEGSTVLKETYFKSAHQEMEREKEKRKCSILITSPKSSKESVEEKEKQKSS